MTDTIQTEYHSVTTTNNNPIDHHGGTTGSSGGGGIMMMTTTTATAATTTKTTSPAPLTTTTTESASDGLLLVVNNDDNNYRPKLGRSCWFGCCDMRRAVIITNCIVFCLSFIGIFSTINMKEQAQYEINNNITVTYYSNDTEQEQLANTSSTIIILFGCCQMICSIIGCIGAIQFNPHMVSFTGIFYMLLCVSVYIAYYTKSFIFVWISVSTVFTPATIMYAYPHYFFVKEYYAGTMTKTNYHNEKQSCCCV